jgi:uncharacterized protein (TIGR03382 family)
MLLLLSAMLPVAHAACDVDRTPQIMDMLPLDGTIGVDQAASVGAFVRFDDKPIVVQLLDEDGEVVPSRRSLRAWDGIDESDGPRFLVLLTPDEAMVEGAIYTVEAQDVENGDGVPVEARFTVGGAASDAPLAPRLTIDAVVEENGEDPCDFALSRRFTGEITGQDDAWSGVGLLSIYATYPGGGLDRLIGVIPSPGDGELVDIDLRGNITNEDDVGSCLAIVPEGPARSPGDTRMVCMADIDVPRDGAYSGGAGCSATGLGAMGFGGLLASFAALGARRRRED